MKKILLNYYSRKNFGDDLFVELFSKYFSEHKIYRLGNPFYVPRNRNKNVKVSLWSYVFTVLGKIQSLSKNNKWTRYFDSLSNKVLEFAKKGKDANVLIGGSIFQEHKTDSIMQEIDFSVREGRCEFELDSNIQANKNTFIIGANLGPVYSKHYFDNTKARFKYYAHITLRDYASYNAVKECGNVQYAPDITFMYKPRKNVIKDTLVISIMNIENQTSNPIIINAYYRLLEESAKEFLEMGQRVRVLSFCKREGDDIAALKLSQNVSGYDQFDTYSYDGDSSKLMEYFERASMVIATRFHSMIMAFVHDVPVFPIMYNCKMEHYLQDIEFNGKYATLENLDIFDVTSIKECYENGKNYNCDSHKKYAYLQFSALEKHLNEKR